MEEITVIVIELKDRSHYLMQYKCPFTGKRISKSTGVLATGKKADRKEAERVAGEWRSQLREGRYHAPGKITWAEFRDRYESEVLASLAENTDRKVSGVFNAVESILNPDKLRDVTADRLSYFQSKLRDAGKAESTIDTTMAHLKASIKWAVTVGMIPAAPSIKKPKRAKASKVMKGRPITGEEFDRLLDKAPDASWRHYLRGLWLSGLRLEESLELYWDRDDKLCVDLSGKRPMLLIPGELEKGGKTRVLPMAPEFARFLMETPQDERTGPVFAPQATRRRGDRLTAHRVGVLVSKIGKAAGVKVNTSTKGGAEVVKFASAHDLRRSFGERWASRVMPQVLMELMRHESIDTTLKFYVGRNAQKTADVLWAADEAVHNSSHNSSHFQPQNETSTQDVNP